MPGAVSLGQVTHVAVDGSMQAHQRESGLVVEGELLIHVGGPGVFGVAVEAVFTEAAGVGVFVTVEAALVGHLFEGEIGPVPPRPDWLPPQRGPQRRRV